jgi:hypothetical protein
MTDSLRGPEGSNVDPAAERPLTEGEKDTVKVASAPATAAAGAAAGATAGLVTVAFGPIGAMVGAIVGALAGGAAGAAGGHAVAGDLYTAEHDAHYRALWEARLDRPADLSYERSRLAYQYGHIAAQQPAYRGRYFTDVEPELRQRWSDDFRAHGGEWEAVRRYVEDAYSHSRSLGLGSRRDPTVIGSAGSAVDPDELERARAGLPSVGDPTPPVDRELR